MSHELDKKADGTGAMFSVGETPWHQGETNSLVLDRSKAPRTAKEAAVAGGLDWEVDLRPAYILDVDGTPLEITGARGITRTDRTEALGIVGKIYRPLQNLRMLETMQPLVDQGLATWETAGSLQGGRRVWGLVKLNLDSKIIRKAYGKELVPFEVIMNSHDGRTLVTMAETLVRIVCRNTQIMAEHDIAGRETTQRVRHNSEVESNVAKAAQVLWADLVSRHEGLATQIALLKRTRMDQEIFARLVLDAAVPMPEQGKTSDLAAKLMKTRIEKANEKREVLIKLWTDGLGQSADHSAWHAFNALTEATDHDRGVFTPKNRAAALLPTGALQTVKATVWENLLGYANEQNHAVTMAA